MQSRLVLSMSRPATIVYLCKTHSCTLISSRLRSSESSLPVYLMASVPDAAQPDPRCRELSLSTWYNTAEQGSNHAFRFGTFRSTCSAHRNANHRRDFRVPHACMQKSSVSYVSPCRSASMGQPFQPVSKASSGCGQQP